MSAEILATVLGVELRHVPTHDARLDRNKQTAFGYRLLYNPSITGNSATTEIPDIIGMQR